MTVSGRWPLQGVTDKEFARLRESGKLFQIGKTKYTKVKNQHELDSSEELKEHNQGEYGKKGQGILLA